MNIQTIQEKLISSKGDFSFILNCDKIDNSLLRIATPFLYPDGSNIDVFLEFSEQKILVTDFAQTVTYILGFGTLFYKEFPPETTKIIENICKNLNVTRKNWEFSIEVESLDKLFDAMVRIVQASTQISNIILPFY